MKKYIILLLATLYNSIAWTQHCPENTTEPTVDIFDWRDPANYVYHIFGVPEADVPNYKTPFEQQSAIGQSNVSFLQANTDKDFSPEDGWELIRKEFGTSTDEVGVPYFILYNKFESKLRVFFLFKYDSNIYNGALIKFSFSNEIASGQQNSYQSGLFEFNSPPLNAIDNMTKEMKVAVLNEYNNAGFTWLHADIPVAYDPCTCEFPSIIEIEPVMLYHTSQVNLVIKNGGVIEEILTYSGEYSPNFKVAIHESEGNFAKGVKVYQSLTGFKKTVEAIDNSLAITQPGNTVAKKITKEVPVFKFPDWMKQLPHVGEATAILDLFMGGGKTTSAPKPMRFESELNFTSTGVINTYIPYAPILINTPGADKTGLTTLNNTAYDNVLGHFNLLKTPKIEVFESREATTGSGSYGAGFKYTRRFKLQEDLSYVLNPASGLSIKSIDAAIVVRASVPDFGSLKSKAKGMELYSEHVGFEDTTISTPGELFRTPFIPLGCLKDYVFAFDDANWQSHGSDYDFKHGNYEMYVQIRIIFDNETLTEEDEAIFLGSYNTTKVSTTVKPALNFLADIKEEVVVENISLTSDQTIRAWENIRVGNNINTGNFKLTLISGGTIDITATQLNPNVSMKIETPSGCERQVLPITGQELRSFCQNTARYNPVLQTRSTPVTTTAGAINPIVSFSSFPNPFNDAVNIVFDISKESKITLTILNTIGQELDKIMDKEIRASGKHVVEYNSNHLPSGIYFAFIEGENFQKTIKLVKY
jgi:hypothetical protein